MRVCSFVFVDSRNVRISYVVTSVEYNKWWILLSVPSYSLFTSCNRFVTCSVNVAFVFVLCFVIVMLLAKANNENTPKATLVASAVPYVVCALRFFSYSFSRYLRKREYRRSTFSWGFDLLGIVKDFVSKLWDYRLLCGLELYESIWTPALTLLNLFWELVNELAADWFIG